MRRSPAYIETPQIRLPPAVNISHQNIRGVHSEHTQNFIYPTLKCKWPIHTKLLAPNDLISLSYRTQYCVWNDNVYYELKKKIRLKYLSATWPVLEDFLGFLKVSLSRHNETNISPLLLFHTPVPPKIIFLGNHFGHQLLMTYMHRKCFSWKQAPHWGLNEGHDFRSSTFCALANLWPLTANLSNLPKLPGEPRKKAEDFSYKLTFDFEISRKPLAQTCQHCNHMN